jgi:hypothetical protein
VLSEIEEEASILLETREMSLVQLVPVLRMNECSLRAITELKKMTYFPFSDKWYFYKNIFLLPSN